MGLETATWFDDLEPLNPPGSDPFSQGDDHLRLIKQVIQNQFTSLGQQAVTVTAEHLNGAISYGAGTGMTSDIYFTDSTKGIDWTLPSTKHVHLSANETTVDAIDYDFLESTGAGLVVNAGDAAQDSGFIACMVDINAAATAKPAIIGFNDIADYAFQGGLQWGIDPSGNKVMYVGQPDSTTTLDDLVLRAGPYQTRLAFFDFVVPGDTLYIGAPDGSGKECAQIILRQGDTATNGNYKTITFDELYALVNP